MARLDLRTGDEGAMTTAKKLALKLTIYAIWVVYRLGYFHGKIETRIKVMIGR